MSNDDQKPPIKPPTFSQNQIQQQPGAFGAMIPDKNGDALLSYYLGLFSIIPCAGLVMGPIAFVKGRNGLAKEKANPQIRGGTHARVGIGCGLIGFLFNLGIVLLAIAIATKARF